MDHPSPARGFPVPSDVVSKLGLRRLARAATRAATGIFRCSEAGSSGRARPGVLETLEDRRLLSSVSLVNGTLNVIGNLNDANKLVVQPSSSSNLFAYANNVSKTVSKS